MRIGIIGAGVSGMTAAWLLQHDHRRHADRRGAAARRARRDAPGRRRRRRPSTPSSAPRFFFDSAYPYFLGAPAPARASRSAGPTRSVSFTDVAREHTVVLPPRSLRHVASLLRSPRLLRHVLSLRRLIDEQPAVAARRDFSVTFRRHLAESGYPASFGPEFAYPFLAACWGAPLDEAPRVPRVLAAQGDAAGRRGPASTRSTGGCRGTSSRSATELTRVDVRLGAGVRRVDARRRLPRRGRARRAPPLRPADRGHLVARRGEPAPRRARGRRDAARPSGRFATSRPRSSSTATRRSCPRDRRDWAHNNLFLDGETAWMSDWQGLRDGVPVFRTWLPKGRAAAAAALRAPELPPPDHEARQRRPAATHRRASRASAGLWVTGMYAVDVDNHESALLSALVPAHGAGAAVAEPRAAARAVAPTQRTASRCCPCRSRRRGPRAVSQDGSAPRPHVSDVRDARSLHLQAALVDARRVDAVPRGVDRHGGPRRQAHGRQLRRQGGGEDAAARRAGPRPLHRHDVRRRLPQRRAGRAWSALPRRDAGRARAARAATPTSSRS